MDTNRVLRYSKEGVVLAVWGSGVAGNKDGQFNGPVAMTIVPGRGLLVLDNRTSRAQLLV
jgi:hypothetical protein